MHCTLNETTHHIIDDKAFAKIQNEVMLINTSQEAFIDIKVCIQALKPKILGLLGLDVYEQVSKPCSINRNDNTLQDDLCAR